MSFHPGQACVPSPLNASIYHPKDKMAEEPIGPSAATLFLFFYEQKQDETPDNILPAPPSCSVMAYKPNVTNSVGYQGASSLRRASS